MDQEGKANCWTLTAARNAVNARKVDQQLAERLGGDIQIVARLFGTTWNHAKTIMEVLRIGGHCEVCDD